MKATFIVRVDVDPDHLRAHARHRQKPREVARREFLGLLECRLADSIRFVDGVERTPISIVSSLDDTTEPNGS